METKTIVLEGGPFNGSQVLFRIAKARCARASRHAREAVGGDTERRQRERDAGIEVIVMTQAALEAYVNWVFLCAEITPTGRSWIGRWVGLRQAAKELGLPDHFGLPKEHKSFFNALDAWRNFILHGDEQSRIGLQNALKAKHPSLTVGQEMELLTAAYVHSVLERANLACRWAEHCTGILAPFIDDAWVAMDE